MNFLIGWPDSMKKSSGWEISGNQREINEWYRTVTQADRWPCLKCLQGKDAKLSSNPEETNGKNIEDDGEWIPVSAWSRRTAYFLLLMFPEQQIWSSGNRKRRGVDNGSDLEKDNNIKMAQSRTQVRTSATKERQRVLVIEDSMLRDTVAPICHVDNPSEEICCLPESRIQDMRKRLPGILKLDFYLLLFF